jgi:tetratricopeptide (TPR) repeat protein
MGLSSYSSDELQSFAERSLKMGDYESAARFFYYLAVYYGVMNDEENWRKFSMKSGECYILAAERMGDLAKAIALCLKAVRILRDVGDASRANLYGLKAWEYYVALNNRNNAEWNVEGIHSIKLLGDFFADNGDFERAAVVYWNAAEKALNMGKLNLAGGLYKDSGDSYRKIGKMEPAIRSYLRAAEAYFRCQEYFESAWRYCEAGFMLIYMNRLKEALEVSEKAELACYEGRIEIFLKDLSHICKLLSQGSIDEARKKWDKIKLKIRGENVKLIENLFKTIKSQ